MGYRSSKLYMSHSFPSDLCAGDLHSAFVTDDAFVLDPLIFSAMAFPVFCRSEDPFAEKTILLRLKRAVIDRFGFLDLTVRPFSDLLR